jgi:DMSO/TMAO reductase YedYZ molybdopterin-dependent catalytic subunit
LDDITRHEPTHAFITLSCISNPVGGPLISTTRWTGTSMQRILPFWKLRPEATHLKIHGADGFYEIVALETIQTDQRMMLTYAWDGVPLPMEHGFPLRIYIPSRYCMKQPKWIVSIEATDHWEPGFSVAKTWDKDAIMETTSVIDTVVVSDDAADANARGAVFVGGIAHAGARGISKV